MKTFKYKVIKTTENLPETKLNEFGRRGYELTGVLYDTFGYTYYFKTEVNNG